MIKMIDLFSGVGGVAQGFAMSGGFETLLVNDVDRDMCDAFSINFKDYDVVCDSIVNLNFRKKFGKQKIDLVIGGPPCQAYSTSGKRLMEDPRAVLYHEYYRCLSELQPKMFVYENVKGLLSMAGGALFDDVKVLFSSLGYHVQARVLNAADYGVPQERERVIVVGLRDGMDFSYPEPTHQSKLKSAESSLFPGLDLPSYITLKDALSDLPLIHSGESSDFYKTEPINDYQKLMRSTSNNILYDHNAPNHGESLMNVIRHVPIGGLKNDIPEKYRPKSGFPNSYGRLWWDRPSTTITRNFGTPSSARCIHPLRDRALTTREGARLQSFPDDFRFFGSRSKRNLQIGNAVPPLLALAIANEIKKAF
jgi:DNA (cytosine-5)-methyltransferase 1